MGEEIESMARLAEIPEEKQRNYMRWKKNSKLLYDYLNTNTNKWPSLTCQIFPDLDTSIDEHRVLLSSFTSSQFPEDESMYVARFSTLGHLKWSSLSNFDIEDMEFKMDNGVELPHKGLSTDVQVKYPAGDCNRARYCPSNPDLIATASSAGALYIFDRTKHSSSRSKLLADNEAKYEIECQLPVPVEDSEREATSVAWNWQRQGSLASSYSSGDVAVWDLMKYSKSNTTISEPQFTAKTDSAGCNDLAWMVNHDALLACCGESNVLGLIDIRDPLKHRLSKTEHHDSGINACQFNPNNDMLLSSADSAGRINFWDIRDFTKPIRTIYHEDAVSSLQWNHNLPTVIASAGQTLGTVKLWDMSAPTDDALIFTHCGHMLGVNDISWDLHDPWLMCSVSNDNSIHLWRPAATIVGSNETV
ncbi:LAMI_0E07294g1_1 [Lachancea mirantina]|uniref:LAMI_0E07294g1_1 n=1 Tax=Lachancea mirantina TaxID=1230905 RepID=A0A1G4JMD7_9SACH|nr:LAMI_0E07294g1_1 [Lachancea mirantina]